MKKLQNRKTNKIGFLICGKGSDYYVVSNDNWDMLGKYDSLTYLNEEWKDYEEPKEYYFISDTGNIKCEPYNDDELDRESKAIGNYFETEEDAKKSS